VSQHNTVCCDTRCHNSSSAFLALADFWCAPFAEGSVQSLVRRRVVHLLACLHSEAKVKCRLSCGQQAAAVGEAR